MIEHRELDANGVRLHYATKGEGPVIVFLHGFPEFWYAWKEQLEAFGKEYCVVAPDLRGHNLSEKPEPVEAYKTDVIVEDVRALVTHVSPHRPVVLVGHDWGGVVAWLFAMRYPELLERLVIINAPHPAIFARELRHNKRQRKASSYFLLFRLPYIGEAALTAFRYALLKFILFKTTVRPEAFPPEVQRIYTRAWAQPGAIRSSLKFYRAASLKGGLLKADFPVIRTPTLVIWGEKDRALLRGNLDGLEKYVESLEVQRVPAGTHWVVHEFPEVVNGHIRRFLSARADSGL